MRHHISLSCVRCYQCAYTHIESDLITNNMSILHITLSSEIFLSLLGIEWDTLPEQQPPKLLPYLPSKSADCEDLGSNYDV